MEDFGDILYIIFAVIAVVYSFIKKGAQKAKEATPPIFEPDEYSESDEPDFRTIEGAPGSRATVVHTAPLYAEPRMELVVDNSMEEKKRQMEQSFLRIKRTSDIKKTIELEEEDTGTDYMADFDLSRAVIYAEVLKRPEF